MHGMHVSDLDLNLLRPLYALLEEQSVTRAADQVGLSQSAMSHALGRLREVFGDPLLVRSSRTMVRTPRGEALREPVREAMRSLEVVFQGGPAFRPDQASGHVTVACEDYVSSLFAPGWITRLAEEAPAVDIDIQGRNASTQQSLESGEVDVAIGVFFGNEAGLRQRKLFNENFACLVRAGHPGIGKRLTLNQYVRHPHILVGTSGRGVGAVDVALAELGKRRRVAARVGTFLSAPLIVAETDLILTVPRRLAERFVDVYGLALFAPPLELRDFTYSMRWHERWHADPRHRWLRSLLAAVCNAG